MIDVVCAIIQKDKSVLICQRPAGKAHAGFWEFPGGKIEEEESAREALKREIFEELGCNVFVGAELQAIEHDYEDISIKLYPFYCELSAGEEPKCLEHNAMKWLKVDELLKEEFLAAADFRIAEQLSETFCKID